MVRLIVSASSVPGRLAMAMRMSLMDASDTPRVVDQYCSACVSSAGSCDSVADGFTIVDAFVEFRTLPEAANTGSLLVTRRLSNDAVPPFTKRPSEPSATGALKAHVVTYAPFTMTATDVPLSESDSV